MLWLNFLIAMDSLNRNDSEIKLLLPSLSYIMISGRKFLPINVMAFLILYQNLKVTLKVKVQLPHNKQRTSGANPSSAAVTELTKISNTFRIMLL